MESSMERWAGMLKLGNKIGYICNYGAWMKRAKPVLIVYVNLSQVKKKPEIITRWAVRNHHKD